MLKLLDVRMQTQYSLLDNSCCRWLLKCLEMISSTDAGSHLVNLSFQVNYNLDVAGTEHVPFFKELSEVLRWRKRFPHLNKVYLRIVQDAKSRSDLLDRQELDILPTVKELVGSSACPPVFEVSSVAVIGKGPSAVAYNAD